MAPVATTNQLASSNSGPIDPATRNGIANQSAPSGNTLVDPTTLNGTTPPCFPLSQNNLVEYRKTTFAQNALVSRIAHPRGSHLCYVTTQIPVPKPTWSSVQTSRTAHVELNSALVYMNHSCAPTVAGEVRVARDRDLAAGEEMVWFYPSTEWASPRPFECVCGAGEGVCIGRQRGGKYLPREVLARYFINRHVQELAEERDAD